MARGGKHGAKVAPGPNVQAQRQAEVRSPHKTISLASIKWTLPPR